MTTATAEPLEKRVAATLAKLESVFEGDDSLPALRGRVKAIVDQVDGLTKKSVDVDRIVGELEKIRAQQERLTEQIRTSRGAAYVPGLEDEAKHFSLLNCMAAHIHRDWRLAPREKEVLDAVRAKAAQSVGDDSLGGFFVPWQVIPEVIPAIYTASVLVSLDGDGTTLVSTVGGLKGPVKIPKWVGATTAQWAGEVDSPAASTAEVGEITLNPKKLMVFVQVTDSMLKFGGFGFEGLLRRDMTKAAAKKVDSTILYGKGVGDAPRGIFMTPKVPLYNAEHKTNGTVDNPTGLDADWSAAELDFDGLDLMQLVIEENDVTFDESFRTVFAPRFKRRLRQLKVQHFATQAEQRSYLLGMPMLSDERLAGIIGDFATMNQIPTSNKPGASVGATTTITALKSTDVVMGNLSTVLFATFIGLTIEDDAGRGADFRKDITNLKLKLYADIQVRREKELIVCPNVTARD